MKISIFIAICSSLCVLPVSPQDVTTVSQIHPARKQATIANLLRQTRPKALKRSPGNSPFLSPVNPRILNTKSPTNVLQNGPYYINHYIYCDNLDQHTLDQIKSGTFSSDKQIQLLNQQKFSNFDALTPSLDSLESSGFDSFKSSSYTGDKEIHILHLPKDKPHDYDDVKLHLSLLDAHSSPDIPDIDLDLNRNLGNFEVNLASIKPPRLDSSLLPTPTISPINEIVKPLVKGHISGGLPHKYNIHLDQIAHYLKGNSNGNEQIFQQHSGDYQTGIKDEILDVPHFEQHPLEFDPSKSSYDTPGAVDSYGHPLTDSRIKQTSQFHNSGTGSRPNLGHLIPNEHQGEFSSGFENTLKNEDSYLPVDYFNQLNDLHRKRRQGVKSLVNKDTSSLRESSGEEARHPNHRYD